MAIFDIIKAFAARFKPHRKANGDFVRRRRFKIAVTNLSSLSEVWEVRGRKWSLITAASLVFAIIGIAWILAFVYTPLRNALPARLQSDLRDNYVDLSARLDSMQEASEANLRFVRNIIEILGDSVPDPVITETPTTLPLDSLAEASKAERSFVQRFEDAERYNLSVLAPIAAAGMSFYPPVLGIEFVSNYSDAGVPYLTMRPGKATPVSAVYRGTVISCNYITGLGVTLAIQHPNDFISVYSGLSESFVTKGDKVNAGTRLGIASDSRYPLTFELWHNGSPLPPLDFISVTASR